jgi:hypothetical protein
MGANGNKARRVVEIIEDDEGNIQVGPVTLHIRKRTMQYLMSAWRKLAPRASLDHVVSQLLDEMMEVVEKMTSQDRPDGPPAGDPPLPS